MDKRLIDADKLLTDLKDKKKSLRESLNFAKREGETKWADELREQMQILTLIIDGIERGGYDTDPIPLPTIKPGDKVQRKLLGIHLDIEYAAEKERADKLQSELSEYTEAHWKAFEQEKKLREAIEAAITQLNHAHDYEMDSRLAERKLREVLASLYPKEEEAK